MFKPKKKTQLDIAVDNAILDMRGHTVTSDEYAEILTRVERLTKLQPKPQQVSLDTMVVVAANIAVTLMIIKHENVNVITSKALSFVIKPKTP